MNLGDIIQRERMPKPWAEGDNIPWNDPDFSARMLQEHLSQAHDAASRRFGKIDRHVQWIHHRLGQPSRVLDLGCGPGLYSSRLAKLGHTCVGIDYSPASIAYAIETAKTEKLNCTYHLQDLREADFGAGFDFAMLIFGEFNVFRTEDIQNILKKAHEALKPGGQLVLEPHTFEAVCKLGEQSRSWYSTPSGLFSDQPHLCLSESFWDADERVAIQRYYIVDEHSGNVTRHSASMQAYTDEQYRALLADCGFSHIEFYPSLHGEEDAEQSSLFAIVARA